MSRIAKSHVNAAFDWAAGQISEAGGRDGITSRAEIRRKISELTGVERDLVDFFYRFILKQGAGASERVTRTDIDAALATARQQLVAAFDTDNNGLSSDEVAAMPLLGRIAVKVARRRTRTPTPTATTSALPAPPASSSRVAAPPAAVNIVDLFWDADPARQRGLRPPGEPARRARLGRPAARDLHRPAAPRPNRARDHPGSAGNSSAATQ